MSQQIKLTIIGNNDNYNTKIFNSYPHKKIKCNSGNTIGLDFKIFSYYYNSIIYRIQFWNLSSQDRYTNLLHSYLNDSDAFILVLDSKKNIDNVICWIPYIQNQVMFVITVHNKVKSNLNYSLNLHLSECQIVKEYNIQDDKLSSKITKDIINKIVEINNNFLIEHNEESCENDTLITSYRKTREKNIFIRLLQCCNTKTLVDDVDLNK